MSAPVWQHYQHRHGRHDDWQKGWACSVCGGECSFNITLQDVPRCRSCWAKTRITSVLPTLLECNRCREWLPDDSFTSSRMEHLGYRRGRRPVCRACETVMRRARRIRNGSA
jgi:hypothetical protein